MYQANHAPLSLVPAAFAAGIVCLAAVFNISAAAQTAPVPAANLSGIWELRFDSLNVPPAALIAAVAAENPNLQFEHDRKEIRWCHFFGVPYMMQQSPIDIVQNEDEIVQVPEVHTFARHIYLDGRKHPDPDHLLRSVNGHSIGHWEGDTLVVDSIGFTGGGGTPGGGRVGPNSHLVERFKLLEGGRKLSVTFTWDDPSIYLKPHTYELTYYRSEPGTYAFEEYCHADEAAQGGSIVAPPQK